MKWTALLVLISLHVAAAFLCPGGRGQCKKGMTCCELPSGDMGCCPYRNAVCCKDKIHCCPSGQTCDLSGLGGCVPKDSNFDTLLTLVDFRKSVNSIEDDTRCPDGSQCPDQDTCCQMQAGSYGCCPLPNAVCCSDKQHCCPQDTVCGEGGFCTQS